MKYRRSIAILLCLTLVLVFAQAGFPGAQPSQSVFAADTDPNAPAGPQRVYLPLVSTQNNNANNTKQAHAAANGSSGMLCTTSSSPNPSFTLTASADYISMPDGNSIFTWSYSPSGGGFQFPGPVLCVNQGDNVTVVLNNTLPEATSIVFLGIDNVMANGAPAQPQFSGATLTSLTNSAAATNGSVTYSFVAGKPGTYLYESGADVGKQVQMGLYGALVVRPAGHPDWAYTNPVNGNAVGQFLPATEYVILLSEMDPNLHSAIELGQPYDVTTLHPRYWLINGRSFPDTIAANNAAWLPNQPYSALVHVKVTDPPGSQSPALVRYLDAGSLGHPFHPHAQNGRVIARDATPLVDATGNDLSYETFAFTIGSGQTWDQLYTYEDQEHFDPTSNPVPVTMPQLQNLVFKDNATYYSGSPYLGKKGQLPVGTTSFNECGEFYMVWHSHALNEVANYDAGFGGMLTLERIDPLTAATGTTCSQ
ncbi:MAG: multicopper oxidase domain-containing protein [Caldilineaceae bacterium]